MNIAIVLAGGCGTRLGGDIPKQYIEVGGQPIINYCLATLAGHPSIDGIWIVANRDWHSFIWEQMEESVSRKFLGISLPGENRQLSIVNAMEDIAKYRGDQLSGTDTVFVHDAARPCLKETMIQQCYDALFDAQGNALHDGVIPVLPMKDTVYLSKDGKVVTALLERSEVYAGQAPELFLLKKYRAANESLISRDKNGAVLPESPILKINGSTEPAILSGMDMAMIPGDEGNYKITTAADLERFQGIS